MDILGVCFVYTLMAVILFANSMILAGFLAANLLKLDD